MKVTSLKDMESYIYWNVILPLKGLDVDISNVSSPMTNSRGRTINLHIGVERTDNVRYDHNYQREEARLNAKPIIVWDDGSSNGVLGDYDRKKQVVCLYESQFDRLSSNKMLLNKLVKAFNENSPFSRVDINRDIRRGYEMSVDDMGYTGDTEEDYYDGEEDNGYDE